MKTGNMLAAILAALCASPVLAQQVTLSRSVIAGGGGDVAAGAWQLRGAIGQVDAHPTLTAGPWHLTGGFWAVGPPPPPPPCDGDTDGNRVVDLADLATVLSQFGRPGTDLAGDVNGDGEVSLPDLAIVLALFGTSCPGAP